MRKIKNKEEDVIYQQFSLRVIHGQKRMVFDYNSRLLATIGKTSVNIIPLSRGGEHVQSFDIDKEKFSKILDVNCFSNPDFMDNPDENYRCEIACKSKQENCIEILEVRADQANIM